MNCSNYRPISLINVDTKILARTLSHRLKQVFQKLIQKNQVGFVKKRHSSDNVCQVVDVVTAVKNCKVPMPLLAPDAEKAMFLEGTFLCLTKDGVW